MKKILLGLSLLIGPFANAQVTAVDVYGCGAYSTPPSQTVILNSNGVYSGSCVSLTDENNYLFNSSTYNTEAVSQQTVQASKSIKADATCHIGPFTTDKNMHWKIQPNSTDLSVAVINYTDLNEVAKLKMLELGVRLPTTILAKINNFVTHASSGDKLNPFVDWDIDVEAVFTNYITGETKTIDGFYYRLYTTNNTANGIDWVDQGTLYPFRVRFSPPEIGVWKCVINVKISGVPTYSSNPFNFNVVEIGAHGYTTVHDNQKNLELDGRIIMPIGQTFPYPVEDYNYGWLPGNGPKATSPVGWDKYHQDLSDYYDLGGKYIRIVLDPQASLIEFEEKGNYYDRLHYAWELDQYIQYCDDHDIMLNFNMMYQITLQQYGAYGNYKWDFGHYAWNSTTQQFYYDWSDPYPVYCYNDTPNGVMPGQPGFELPHQMFDEDDNDDGIPDADRDMDYLEQRLRYYIARYGYSTSIMQFEFMSESYAIDKFTCPGPNCPSDLTQFDSYEFQNTPQGNQVRAALLNYNTRMSNYVKNVMNHKEHLLGLHAYDNSGTVGGYGIIDDPSCDLTNIDVIGLSSYHTEPHRFMIDANTDGVSAPGSSENSAYRKATYYTNKYHKPFMHFEQGSLMNRNSNYAVHKVDVSVVGFTGCAGFFPWEGYFPIDKVAWPSTVQAQNWMNSDLVIDVLSSGSTGNWKQGRMNVGFDDSPYGSDKVRETEYYVNAAQTEAVGYVMNRTHNYYTKGSGDNLNYPVAPLFSTLTDLNWNDANRILYVSGLDHYDFYKCYWYDYLTGELIDEDCGSADVFGRFHLRHPTLTVANNPTADRPVLWFRLEKDDCGSGLAQSNPDYEYVKGDGPGISSVEEGHLTVSPNPFVKELEITIDAAAEIQIYNSSNELVYAGSVSRGVNSLNLDKLSKGIYFLKLSTNDKVYKIVKI